MIKLIAIFFVLVAAFSHTSHASRSADVRDSGRARTTHEESRRTAESRDLTPRAATISGRTPGAPARSATIQQQQRTTARSATQQQSARNISRAAVTPGQQRSPARSATTPRDQNRTARSATQLGRIVAPVGGARSARSAEALGGDYARCRDAYTQCMDQFCAAANETYRKCICSDTYIDLAAQREALESAQNALQEFLAFNLTMVTMTGSEVQAALTGTEGELSMREDTSANRQRLDDILNSLNNPPSGSSGNRRQSPSFGSIADFSWDMDDIWGGGATQGAISNDVRGRQLFTTINSQCQQMLRDTCRNTNMSMIVSTYTLSIDVDCQTFQNSLDRLRRDVQGRIREANLRLMQERLNDFDSRNSLTTIECLQNVMSDLRSDLVCGNQWERCLDFTGQFLDQGRPIMTEHFGELASVLNFGSGNTSLLEANRGSPFVRSLEEKRIFAAGSLRTCEQEQEIVWREALNRSLMEIFQSQRRKIDDVKNECLEKLAECSETQTESLGRFGIAGEEELDASGQLIVMEVCSDIQRACESVFGSDTLNNLLELKRQGLMDESCADRGGVVVYHDDYERCVTNQDECTAVGWNWIPSPTTPGTDGITHRRGTCSMYPNRNTDDVCRNAGGRVEGQQCVFANIWHRLPNTRPLCETDRALIWHNDKCWRSFDAAADICRIAGGAVENGNCVFETRFRRP
ncbi:MAG: hypothetical protein FWD33_02685 [Alphaproteobacteria bacterium]|nr:hypothetical protein [Alphaproteobacteria bacterium]